MSLGLVQRGMGSPSVGKGPAYASINLAAPWVLAREVVGALVSGGAPHQHDALRDIMSRVEMARAIGGPRPLPSC